MAYNLFEHNNQISTYRVGGRETGLPVGDLNAQQLKNAHKYFKFEQWKDNPNTEFDCFLSSERCIHTNKSGRQCTRRTVMGVQRCWQHLKLHWKIRIGDAGAMGLGVFAVGKTNNPNEIVFKDKDFISDYLGELITITENNNRYGSTTAPYSYNAGRGYIIDPACRRGVGAFFNHRNAQRANAYFGLTTINVPGSPDIQRLIIRAKGNIKNGQQIFVTYGRNYRMRRNTSRFTTKNKKNTPRQRNATGVRQV